MPPVQIDEWASELNGCAAVLFPCRDLPILGITLRDSVFLTERAVGLGGPSAALPKCGRCLGPSKPDIRIILWLRFARRRDILRLLQSFANLYVATAAYDEEVTGLRCGSNPENLCLEPTRIPPARLAIAAKRPADWPLRGSGRQIKSEDRVLASRTVGKARSWGSGS